VGKSTAAKKEEEIKNDVISYLFSSKRGEPQSI